jgi:hypothetical protein
LFAKEREVRLTGWWPKAPIDKSLANLEKRKARRKPYDVDSEDEAEYFMQRQSANV